MSHTEHNECKSDQHKYIILTTTTENYDDPIHSLVQIVNEHLLKGYVPNGSLIINKYDDGKNIEHSQPMIYYASSGVTLQDYEILHTSFCCSTYGVQRLSKQIADMLNKNYILQGNMISLNWYNNIIYYQPLVKPVLPPI
jgi:hypothetical protein